MKWVMIQPIEQKQEALLCCCDYLGKRAIMRQTIHRRIEGGLCCKKAEALLNSALLREEQRSPGRSTCPMRMKKQDAGSLKLLLAGDVMLGRLVNEILKVELPAYPW